MRFVLRETFEDSGVSLDAYSALALSGTVRTLTTTATTILVTVRYVLGAIDLQNRVIARYHHFCYEVAL